MHPGLPQSPILRCPACLFTGRGESTLVLSASLRADDSGIVHGLLECTRPDCRAEFPIIDRVPLLVPDVQEFISRSGSHLLLRDDLPHELGSLTSECMGPNSWFDQARQHISAYGRDHYAGWSDSQPAHSAVAELTRSLLALAGDLPQGSILDVGAACGRSAIELALAANRTVHTIDMNFTLARLAAAICETGETRFIARRGGLLYTPHTARRPGGPVPQVSTCIADAACPPFAHQSFGAIFAINVLDCFPSPRQALAALRNLLTPGGKFIIATPYDWSGAATAIDQWIGGHSPRANGNGDSARVLRDLLTPGAHPSAIEGLRIAAEADDLPWRVYLHDRSTLHYRVHALVLVRES